MVCDWQTWTWKNDTANAAMLLPWSQIHRDVVARELGQGYDFEVCSEVKTRTRAGLRDRGKEMAQRPAAARSFQRRSQTGNQVGQTLDRQMATQQSRP
ncbi:hypothetical protein RRF57_001563 [Xylaria bambusicola]|uniref:Uncharacterized protein n=1 Tax=Xylaria bambusicola TaxID=326684 RepID=A0AAN7Z0W6_9PEZI